MRSKTLRGIKAELDSMIRDLVRERGDIIAILASREAATILKKHPATSLIHKLHTNGFKK
jgi:hypothetical protein